uniref:Branched-chain amino acid ABC transporter permease n=1 Tax=Archaeoglobus fulgidus TaxID=2234 RepID=A0A7J2TGP8_ARCFL
MLDVLAYIFLYTFIFGCLFLGTAIGFTIITGVLRVFHLGYGMTFLIVAYGTWAFWRDFGIEFFTSIILSFLLLAAITVVVYKFVISKFLEVEDYLLAALLSIFIIIEELISHIYPEIVGVYLPTSITKETISLAGASVPGQLVVVAAVSLMITFIYLQLLVRTKTGLIMRAISQNVFASKLMGVNFDRMFILALVIASIPPGVIILLLSPVWAMNPFIGWPLFTYAILATVLGGLGNLKGTIMASFILGFVFAVTGFLINPRMMVLAALIVVILVLVFKPRGLARAETIW